MSRSKYRDDYEVFDDIDVLTGVVGEAGTVVYAQKPVFDADGRVQFGREAVETNYRRRVEAIVEKLSRLVNGTRVPADVIRTAAELVAAAPRFRHIVKRNIPRSDDACLLGAAAAAASLRGAFHVIREVEALVPPAKRKRYSRCRYSCMVVADALGIRPKEDYSLAASVLAERAGLSQGFARVLAEAAAEVARSRAYRRPRDVLLAAVPKAVERYFGPQKKLEEILCNIVREIF